jgi:glycosyltransferase involved in cell wall biosynthesis
MENVAAQIATGFVEKGYPVSVYTSAIGCSPQATRHSPPWVHYLTALEFAHTPIIFTLFFRLLALPRHSLIHLHVSQAFSPEIVYLISRLRGIRYIAHVHLDVNASGPLGFLLGAYKKYFLKHVLHSAAKIICVSEAQKKLIATKYALPSDSIVTIPNGVAQAYFIGEKTRTNAVPHLLFVGRLVVQKNLPLLIEAVAHMQTNVFLDIVGEGELKESIVALIQQYGLHNVTLHGKKTGTELIHMYQSADIFVLPSLKEAGACLSMLEALATGLPVVAADSPEVREGLADCGVLIQNPTAQSYAAALDALLPDKEKIRELSTLSVERASHYSWEKLLTSIENTYKEICNYDLW